METARSVSRIAFAIMLLLVLVGTVVAAAFGPGRYDEREPDGNSWPRIGGVALGDLDNLARIPRRDFRCTPDPANGVAEVCESTVNGVPMRVEVVYQVPNISFRRCRVFYGDANLSCRSWNYHVGGPYYAGVSAWGLNVSDEAKRTIKGQYPFENVDEATAKGIAQIAAGIVAVCVAGIVFLSVTPKRGARIIAAVSSGGATFLVASVMFVLFLLFAQYID